MPKKHYTDSERAAIRSLAALHHGHHLINTGFADVEWEGDPRGTFVFQYSDYADQPPEVVIFVETMRVANPSQTFWVPTQAWVYKGYGKYTVLRNRTLTDTVTGQTEEEHFASAAIHIHWAVTHRDFAPKHRLKFKAEPRKARLGDSKVYTGRQLSGK